MEKHVYVGIAGHNAIAGPVIITAVDFTEPIESGEIKRLATKTRNNRHVDISVMQETVSKYQKNYNLSTEYISVSKLNNSELVESDVITQALSNLIYRHVARFIKETNNPTIMIPLTTVFNLTGGFGYRTKLSLSPNHNRLIAQWEARLAYTNMYNQTIRANAETYSIKGQIPMSTVEHRESILINGPKAGFHRRKNIKDAREWAHSSKPGDPNYKKVRFYRYRKPKWWSAWFPTLEY